MRDSPIEMIVIVVIGLLAPLAIQAQPREAIPRVGVLDPGAPPVDPRGCHERFRQGLRELGYVEGHNIVLEYRYAEFTPDRLSSLATELVQRQPAVLWTHSNLAAWALKRATATIPIAVAVSSQSVEQGLVESLAQPGGNLTGLESQSVEQTSKRLELLKEALPLLTRVALLFDPASHEHAHFSRTFEAEAQALGIELLPVEAEAPEAFDAAFAAMAASRAEALVLIDNAMFARHSQRLAELALQHRLPTIAAPRIYTQVGGLITYGADIPALCQRSAAYVDKLLKGIQPATLPVERADKFSLVVNLKTAQALGLTLSPMFLVQVDEVIR